MYQNSLYTANITMHAVAIIKSTKIISIYFKHLILQITLYYRSFQHKV